MKLIYIKLVVPLILIIIVNYIGMKYFEAHKEIDFNNFDSWLSISSAILIAPVIEELAFRFNFEYYSQKVINIYLIILTIATLMSFIFYLDAFFVIIIFYILSLLLLFMMRKKTKVGDLISKKTKVIIYISLLFALFHLDFAKVDNGAFFNTLYVVLYLITLVWASINLFEIRNKPHGLIKSIFYHFTLNLTVLATIIIVRSLRL